MDYSVRAERRTVNGVVLTEEMIDAIEANAREGFPGMTVMGYARRSPAPSVEDEALGIRIPAGGQPSDAASR